MAFYKAVAAHLMRTVQIRLLPSWRNSFSWAEFHTGSTFTSPFCSLCMQTPHQRGVCVWKVTTRIFKSVFVHCVKRHHKSPFIGWSKSIFGLGNVFHSHYSMWKTGIEPHILIFSMHLCTAGLHPLSAVIQCVSTGCCLPSVHSHKQSETFLQPSFPLVWSAQHLSSSQPFPPTLEIKLKWPPWEVLFSGC